VPFEAARQTFSNMPEEMFLLWLDDRIRSNGWPPNGPEWEGFLFGLSVEYWQQLKWELKAVQLSTQNLCHSSQQMVFHIIDACVNNNNNIMVQYIPSIRERFQGILQYIAQNQEVPKPLIFLQLGGCYEIVDGSHRLSALETLRLNEATSHLAPTEYTAYIGSIELNA
jgi:hypothetical protein